MQDTVQKSESSTVDFTNTLNSLKGVSLEDLQKMMQETQRALKAKEAEEAANRENELADQLKPWEDRLAQTDSGHEAAVDEIDARIDLLKAEKKALSTTHADEKTTVLNEYNEFRKTLNLKPKTLRGAAKGTGASGTRQRRGEQHKYDIDWKDGENKSVSVKVDKDDTKVFTVDLSDGIPHVRQVEEALTGFGIDIGGGGMARGLVNRIRKMQLKVRGENAEAAAAASGANQ